MCVCTCTAATFMSSTFLIVADMLTYGGVLIVLALLTTGSAVFMCATFSLCLLRSLITHCFQCRQTSRLGLCALNISVGCNILPSTRYLFLPETKGKSLEEMLRYFQEITKESKGGAVAGGLLSDRGKWASQRQLVWCPAVRRSRPNVLNH
jgi:hypothetical protein